VVSMNEKDFKGMAGVEKAYYDRLVNSAKGDY
jgi:hypothetical protein